MNSNNTVIVILCTIIIIMCVLLGLTLEYKHSIGQEWTVKEVTAKSERIEPNVSETYYIWKICNEKVCTEIVRDKTTPLNRKLTLR